LACIEVIVHADLEAVNALDVVLSAERRASRRRSTRSADGEGLVHAEHQEFALGAPIVAESVFDAGAGDPEGLMRAAGGGD
jgi:hypothetical protein